MVSIGFGMGRSTLFIDGTFFDGIATVTSFLDIN